MCVIRETILVAWPGTYAGPWDHETMEEEAAAGFVNRAGRG